MMNRLAASVELARSDAQNFNIGDRFFFVRDLIIFYLKPLSASIWTECDADFFAN